MDFSGLISPTALPSVLVVAALIVLFLRFESGRKAMLDTIASEVERRNRPKEPKEMALKQPFVVAQEDPPIHRSECLRHMEQVTELRNRVQRVEDRLDGDIRRVHDRIDEVNERMDAIPTRVINLMSETKNLTS